MFTCHNLTASYLVIRKKFQTPTKTMGGEKTDDAINHN